MSMSRVLCIEDLSCVGRSSLSVALPILSALGVQACGLPTALLSTHTGGFGAVALSGEGDFAAKALEHFKTQSIHFDAIYSGYLSCVDEMSIVDTAYKDNPGAIRVLDPVLGDNGALYRGINAYMTASLRTLCFHADVITPNVTECMLLLGENPGNNITTAKQAIEYLHRLDELCKGSCVITGVETEDGACNAYISKSGDCELIPFSKKVGKYPGTGDIFASVLTGCLVKGMALTDAIKKAGDFVSLSVQAANKESENPKFGVPFEKVLHSLMA